MGIFTRDPVYSDMTEWAIRVYTLCVIPLAVQYTIVDGFTGMGIAKVAISLSLFRKTLYFASTCVLPMLFTANAAFYAEPIADGVSSVLSTVVFFFVYRKYLKGSGRLMEIKV